MSKAIYFDCFSGASGDMILGALLDAGLPLSTLQDGIASLHLHGFHIAAAKVLKHGISATSFRVVEEEHQHQPEDPALHDHQTELSHHHHRGLAEITEIINSSHLSDSIKSRSLAIFRRLGEVEAAIHGVPLNEVQFHELGALDTIIDIVGTLLGLEALGIQECYSSALPVGSGTVHTAHGLLPVPAPATLKLLSQSGAPLIASPPSQNEPGELLTPTGAVLITTLAKFQRPNLKLEKSGIGAGFKDFPEWPNILRVWIGETSAVQNEDEMVLLETNIDDMNPQVYGYLMEKLLAEKAADVWFTPIQMKKNRPAVMLSVLTPTNLETRMAEIILEETTTLGIRVRTVSRHIAERDIRPFESRFGTVNVKIKSFEGNVLEIAPEYEDIRRIAHDRGLPFIEVQRVVTEQARKELLG
jgi:pyridinium-3,5-bisthiocarboxylic acid mononucleotide nickel chelatase